MRAFIKRLLSRKSAYQRTFLGDDNRPHVDAVIVLADLKRFCYIERTTAKVSMTTQSIDPLAMAFAEGRREVFMRLVGFLNLDDSTINRITEPTQEDDHHG